MNRKALRLVLSLIGFVLGAGFYVHAFAALTIMGCGHSSYSCETGTNPYQTFGRVGGILVVDPASGKSIHIPIGQADNSHVPAGWTDSTTPPDTAPSIPGATVYSASVTGTQCASQGASSVATAAQAAIAQCSLNWSFTHTDGNNWYACIASNCGGGTFFGGTWGQSEGSATCPAGYSDTSGVCVLTNASAVMKPSDGRCGIARTGNTYARDSQDPDCGSGAGTANTLFNTSVSGGNVLASLGDEIIWIDLDAMSGAGLFKHTRPSSSGSTSVQTQVATGPLESSGAADAPITGSAEIVTTGTGTLNDPESVVQGECGAPGQPPCRIDESGTPSGAGAADAAKGQLEAMNPSTFGATPWTGEGVSIFSGLPTLVGSDSCVNPITWVWMGHTLNPDVCAIWAPLKLYLAWLLYALTAIYIWRGATGALQGA